jgi:F-type H+-transporting ATPase subunit delta
VNADMLWLQSVCRSNRDFVNLLRSPVIKADTKKKIVNAVTSGQISVMTTGFTNLLVTKGRESNLPEIVTAFTTAYNLHKNIQTIKLTTAAPVSEAIKSAIVEQVKKSGGFQHIELEEKVNPDLIGGFVIQIGDKLVDASIAYDLKAIAKQFENNDFIYKIR